MAQQISPVSVATADALPPPRPRTEFQVTERQRKKPVAPRIRQRIFKGKSFTEGDTEKWWFASTGIPLLAATIGPLANVCSIAALVSFWRQEMVDGSGHRLQHPAGIPFPDPKWCYWSNLASLIVGFVGNFFLLMNFTHRIRYIVALPITIVLWYIATAILITITAALHIHEPAVEPDQAYTQGYWYAVISAVLYLMCSMMLMINMLGYFLGHYPEHFSLTDHQRTLILQTMLFFIWLGGGAAAFGRVATAHGEDGWSFVNSLYFCDVTILTVGFGDLYPGNDVSRGLIFPYTVVGVIMLGLIIASITKFLHELGEDKVVKRHFERERTRTLERTISRSIAGEDENLRFLANLKKAGEAEARPSPAAAAHPSTEGAAPAEPAPASPSGVRARVRQHVFFLHHSRMRAHHLEDEKERFEEMRRIQRSTMAFKRWSVLAFSIAGFTLLLAGGAVVFWQVEKYTQDMTYFRATYFCYVSLTTLGYGDLSPRSPAGRPFFVVWSLFAVPTMTILINAMSGTVVEHFKHFTFRVGDFTFLLKKGSWGQWLERQQVLQRIKRGFPVGPALSSSARAAMADEADEADEADGDDGDDEADGNDRGDGEQRHAVAAVAAGRDVMRQTIEALDADADLGELELAHKLARAISRAAKDVRADSPRMYSYDEWAEYTELIRFTAKSRQGDALLNADLDADLDGWIEWDWIGADSPFNSGQLEAEFILDRLCESLLRYLRRHKARMRERR